VGESGDEEVGWMETVGAREGERLELEKGW
jgi:hypothetical protein